MRTTINLLIITLIMTTFSSCTSIDGKVKKYRSINEKITEIHNEIATGNRDQEDGISELTKLKRKLLTFDQEVLDQYSMEEKIKIEIERKRKENVLLAKQNAEKFRIDSIKQSKIDEKNARELKKLEDQLARDEVAAMIALEEEADRNEYLAELKEKGIFLVEFNGKEYEVSRKHWNDWKSSQNYDLENKINEWKVMISSMGYEKANGLASSMNRTLSKGINREGITLEAVSMIQMYNVVTKGEPKFD